jgi:hypothetical protein
MYRPQPFNEKYLREPWTHENYLQRRTEFW